MNDKEVNQIFLSFSDTFPSTIRFTKALVDSAVPTRGKASLMNVRSLEPDLRYKDKIWSLEIDRKEVTSSEKSEGTSFFIPLSVIISSSDKMVSAFPNDDSSASAIVSSSNIRSFRLPKDS